jgi:hypothetical protein
VPTTGTIEMKRALPLLALLVTCPTFAAPYGFTTIAVSPDGNATYAVMGIAHYPESDIVGFAQKLHMANKKGGPQLAYTNIASTEEVNCELRVHRSTQMTLYSDNGDVPVKEIFNGQWEKVGPGTIGDSILTYVCAYAAGWKDAKG